MRVRSLTPTGLSRRRGHQRTTARLTTRPRPQSMTRTCAHLHKGRLSSPASMEDRPSDPGHPAPVSNLPHSSRSRLESSPKDVHILIPRTCECGLNAKSSQA